jgi:hypothetical protein
MEAPGSEVFSAHDEVRRSLCSAPQRTGGAHMACVSRRSALPSEAPPTCCASMPAAAMRSQWRWSSRTRARYGAASLLQNVSTCRSGNLASQLAGARALLFTCGCMLRSAGVLQCWHASCRQDTWRLASTLPCKLGGMLARIPASKRASISAHVRPSRPRGSTTPAPHPLYNTSALAPCTAHRP